MSVLFTWFLHFSNQLSVWILNPIDLTPVSISWQGMLPIISERHMPKLIVFIVRYSLCRTSPSSIDNHWLNWWSGKLPQLNIVNFFSGSQGYHWFHGLESNFSSIVPRIDTCFSIEMIPNPVSDRQGNLLVVFFSFHFHSIDFFSILFSRFFYIPPT